MNRPYQLMFCEIFMLEALEVSVTCLVIAVLDFWASKKVSMLYSLIRPFKIQKIWLHFTIKCDSSQQEECLICPEVLILIERAIYCATVDKQDELLHVSKSFSSKFLSLNSKIVNRRYSLGMKIIVEQRDQMPNLIQIV